jgi:hypothetical protein
VSEKKNNTVWHELTYYLLECRKEEVAEVVTLLQRQHVR